MRGIGVGGAGGCVAGGGAAELGISTSGVAMDGCGCTVGALLVGSPGRTVVSGGAARELRRTNTGGAVRGAMLLGGELEVAAGRTDPGALCGPTELGGPAGSLCGHADAPWGGVGSARESGAILLGGAGKLAGAWMLVGPAGVLGAAGTAERLASGDDGAGAKGTGGADDIGITRRMSAEEGRDAIGGSLGACGPGGGAVGKPDCDITSCSPDS